MSKEQLLQGTPPAYKESADALTDTIYSGLKKLELAVGSQQPDVVSVRVAQVLRDVAALELEQVGVGPYRCLRIGSRRVISFTGFCAKQLFGAVVFFSLSDAQE